MLIKLAAMPKELRHSGSQRSPPAAGPAHLSNNHTRPASAWSAEDDERLKSARTQGLNWQPIATQYFPNKSANACRKRHERLMERKNAEDWEGDKLENLATAYMEVRQEMWSILARKVDAKWHIIEDKVFQILLLHLPRLSYVRCYAYSLSFCKSLTNVC